MTPRQESAAARLALLLPRRKSLDLERARAAARFKAEAKELDSEIAYLAAVVRDEHTPAPTRGQTALPIGAAEGKPHAE